MPVSFSLENLQYETVLRKALNIDFPGESTLAHRRETLRAAIIERGLVSAYAWTAKNGGRYTHTALFLMAYGVELLPARDCAAGGCDGE